MDSNKETGNNSLILIGCLSGQPSFVYTCLILAGLLKTGANLQSQIRERGIPWTGEASRQNLRSSLLNQFTYGHLEDILKKTNCLHLEIRSLFYPSIIKNTSDL